MIEKQYARILRRGKSLFWFGHRLFWFDERHTYYFGDPL
jgi:hypothetical protein